MVVSEPPTRAMDQDVRNVTYKKKSSFANHFPGEAIFNKTKKY